MKIVQDQIRFFQVYIYQFCWLLANINSNIFFVYNKSNISNHKRNHYNNS